MKCTCSDLEWPCPIHGDDSKNHPEIVEHHLYCLRIHRRTSNKKWFSTIAKDAIQIFVSHDFDTKTEALICAAQKLSG